MDILNIKWMKERNKMVKYSYFGQRYFNIIIKSEDMLLNSF